MISCTFPTSLDPSPRAGPPVNGDGIQTEQMEASLVSLT